MVKFTKSVFFPPKDKALAAKIRISSPEAFRKSIRELSKNGISMKEKKALVLAQTRARAQTLRPNLSPKERKQFNMIAKMRIPKVSK